MNKSTPEFGWNLEIFATTYCLFLLYPLTSSSLFYERNQHSNPGKMILQNTSPPSSQSAGFPNKVTIACHNTSSLDLLTYHAVSNMNLNSVSSPGERTVHLFNSICPEHMEPFEHWEETTSNQKETAEPWESSCLVWMKKEFIGPGLHLRPVCADLRGRLSSGL